MNARRLLLTLAVLLILGIAFSSRSTLTPKRGADHVFYGAGESHFIGQYAVVGDFNNDGFDDVVTSALWDDPAPGGASLRGWPKTGTSSQCSFGWGTIIAQKSGVKRRVCDFSGAFGDEHWNYWKSLGWDSIAAGDCNYCYPAVQCDSCYTYEIRNENQGALYVVDGASSWASKGHDINFTSTPPSHLITGKLPGDRLYSGLAVGRINNDSYEDLLASSTGANNFAGEAYVIKGASSWASTISLSSTALLQHTFKGRDTSDMLGNGIAVGDLDGDNLDDIVLSASGSSGLGNSKPAAGEIYVFYSSATIPVTVNLAGLTDNQVDALGYVSVIYGPADSSQVGVSPIRNWHAPHHTLGAHRGAYEPIGLAIGDWDDDGFNDLAIGAGWAEKSAAQVFAGAVYIIFGTDPNGAGPHKLVPGNRIDLANAAGSNANAPDMKFVGKTGGRLGAGVAFLDANDQGLNDRDDLMIGAPFTTTGGKNECGEAYIIFGDTKANLLATRTRNVGTTGHVNVTIIGEDVKDRLGSQFEGNDDVDEDGNNDVGVVGEREKYVFFVPSGGSWAGSVDLYDIEETSPSTRMLEMEGSPTARSVTIRFAHVDNDIYGDLVFGGYDNPGHPGDDSGAIHAGQMWVTRGQDMWKSGYVSVNTTWSGVVFVRGDVIVQSGATLTIAAGTDVWVWPTQVGTNIGADDTTNELRVEGGALVVNGTQSARVRFLAWETNGPEALTTNEWFGIWIGDTAPSSATINYATIRNAKRGIQTRSPMTLKNSIIEDCKLVGITVAGDSTNADSVYVQNTIIRRITDSGGIGANILGKKAAANLDGCTVRDCAIGVAAYSKAKLYAYGLTVRNTTIEGVQVDSRGNALLSGGYFESDGIALRVSNGGSVYAGLADFKNSDYGIKIYKGGTSMPSAEFAECVIDSNNVGASVSEADNVEFDQCDVTNSDVDGVSCISGANITIIDCIVADNGATGVRVNNSSPAITESYLGENAGGITCENSAYPLVEANKVWNNNNGIAFVDNANADMDPCSGSCPPCSQGNSFKGNSGYHFSNLTSTTIDAKCNYWGKTTPAPAKFYGPVDYTPYLGSDPLPVSQQPEPPSADEKLPKVYKLTGNSPNPFNPVTTIRYEVPAPGGHVHVRVYNVQGQLVRELVNEVVAPGYHDVVWNGVNERGSEVASGVYFLQMTAPSFQAARKMVMLK